MGIHLKLHATQLKQLTRTQTYPLHPLNEDSNPSRNMKATTFHNNDYTNIIILESDVILEKYKENLKYIHTIITSNTSVPKKQQSH